jgi:hypothetical protein
MVKTRPELLSVVSRNNILHVRHKDGYSIREWSKEPDYDYDLISGKVVSAGNQESHGIVGVPAYAAHRRRVTSRLLPIATAGATPPAMTPASRPW